MSPVRATGQLRSSRNLGNKMADKYKHSCLWKKQKELRELERLRSQELEFVHKKYDKMVRVVLGEVSEICKNIEISLQDS